MQGQCALGVASGWGCCGWSVAWCISRGIHRGVALHVIYRRVLLRASAFICAETADCSKPSRCLTMHSVGGLCVIYAPALALVFSVKLNQRHPQVPIAVCTALICYCTPPHLQWCPYQRIPGASAVVFSSHALSVPWRHCRSAVLDPCASVARSLEARPELPSASALLSLCPLPLLMSPPKVLWAHFIPPVQFYP